MEVRTHSLEEFKEQVTEFARGLRPRADAATVVALSGDLGAGKTTFVQAVAKELGIKDQLASPTFVIEKIYEIRHPVSNFRRFIHIDAYRLKGGHDLEVLGWRELTTDPANLIFLEWPENVSEAVPSSAIPISLQTNDAERVITYGTI